MAKAITNIPTISKIEYLSTTDREFKNPETIAVLSCYLEGDRFKSFEISSIDFETGIIEAANGDLFKTEKADSLADIASQLQKRTHDIGADIPSAEVSAEQLRDIMIEGSFLTIENEAGAQSFRIVNMYYDVASDAERNIIQSKIDEKQETIEKLRENPEANGEKIADLTEKTNLASANIAEEGDKSAKFFTGVGMTLVLQDEVSGQYTIRHFNDLTYSDLSRMTGFESPSAENPDKELISKLEEIRAEISRENEHHSHNFKDDPMEIRGFSNLSIKGDKLTGIADGRRVSFDLADVEVSYSSRGLSLTHVSENGTVDEYLVTGVARDCQAKSTETLFNTICDAKQVVSMSDGMTQDNRSKVMQEIPSLGITQESVWQPGAKAPETLYTVAGQKMKGEELESTVYASEANNFIALKIGNDTKIMGFGDSSIAKTSETLASIQRTDDGFVAITQTNNKQISLDYVDAQNGIAIANGTVYKFEGGPSFTPIGGGEVDTSQIYINNKTNEIEQLVQTHAASSNRLIQNWDIVTEGNTLYLARNNPVIEDGRVVGMEVERLREITGLSLDENRGILRVKFDEGFAHLGNPSNVASENSIYTKTLEDGTVTRVSMAEVIENSPKGIDTVIEQMNNAINTEYQDFKLIKNPQEFVVNTPPECFVIMENKLYFKEGDNIYSKTEMLSYQEVRDKIEIAFNAPAAQETALLERLAQSDLYTTLKDFRDISDIELVSKETFEKFESGRDIADDERIIANTTGSYERELPDEGFDIPMQME